ncbi:MAG: hypothetical protein ABIS47_12390 [Acidimicrobiales bacterium]
MTTVRPITEADHEVSFGIDNVAFGGSDVLAASRSVPRMADYF